MKIKTIYIFLLGFLLLFFLNFNALSSYFSQDDFFHLNAVSQKDFCDVPSFFLSKQKSYGFYRPLSRETFNLVMYKLFDLNPLPYHLFNLFLIILNSVVVFYLSKFLIKEKIVANLSYLIFIFSSLHNIELYYLASVQTLLASFFLGLSILMYLYYLHKSSLVYYFSAVAFFLLAIFSHEISLILVGCLFFIELINKFNLKKIFLRLLPFVVVSIIYLFSTSLFTSLPTEGVYQPNFNPKAIINTFGWYIIWSFNMPEMLVDFVGPKFAINPNLFKWYPEYFYIIFPFFVFIVLSILSSLIVLRKKLTNKYIILSTGLFIVSLSPFLFFPQKKFIYYLEFAYFWFSILLSFIFLLAWKGQKVFRIWVILGVLSLFTIALFTDNLNKSTYWAAKRAKAAQFIVNDIKVKVPNPPKGAIFYIQDDPDYPFIAEQWGSSSKQAFYILSGQDAFQLLYNDPTVKVYFESIDGLSGTINSDMVIKYVAKFPF